MIFENVCSVMLIYKKSIHVVISALLDVIWVEICICINSLTPRQIKLERSVFKYWQSSPVGGVLCDLYCLLYIFVYCPLFWKNIEMLNLSKISICTVLWHFLMLFQKFEPKSLAWKKRNMLVPQFFPSEFCIVLSFLVCLRFYAYLFTVTLNKGYKRPWAFYLACWKIQLYLWPITIECKLDLKETCLCFEQKKQRC